jgi:hypothetical protein
LYVFQHKMCAIVRCFLCERTREVHISIKVCLTNQALIYEDVWASGCTDPRFLDLGINWRCVQLLATAALTPGKSPRYPLYRRLRGPQTRSVRPGVVNILGPKLTRIPTPSY